jgi:hypothetical protein
MHMGIVLYTDASHNSCQALQLQPEALRDSIAVTPGFLTQVTAPCHQRQLQLLKYLL